MSLEFLKDFIVLVVLGICLCVGYILKHIVTTDKINKYIPLIVAVLGVAINLWINAWQITPAILLGGLASGLASTGLHQLFKKFIESDIGGLLLKTFRINEIEIIEDAETENLKE